MHAPYPNNFIEVWRDHISVQVCHTCLLYRKLIEFPRHVEMIIDPELNRCYCGSTANEQEATRHLNFFFFEFYEELNDEAFVQEFAFPYEVCKRI